MIIIFLIEFQFKSSDFPRGPLTPAVMNRQFIHLSIIFLIELQNLQRFLLAAPRTHTHSPLPLFQEVILCDAWSKFIWRVSIPIVICFRDSF
jgi:hypothetical protein